ncbi:MAG: ATP synthase F1 subunit gamma [Oscillospiraceae bacterium]|nr:ATP synthase F1 subunit gamma [Oscillospiraceae bacterium]
MSSATAKGIKTRINSLKKTEQITKAMEMVAASKLNHAQAKVLNSRPYFEILFSTISNIAASESDLSSPYLGKRDVKKSIYIVIAGDRGLAGGYNHNILKMCLSEIEAKNAVVLPIGNKAVEYFKLRNADILTENYADAEGVGVGDCFSIAKALCKDFKAGKYDEICVGYTNFVSVLSQTPAVLPLLPLKGYEKGKTAQSDILYEPSSGEAFDAIIPEYLGGVLYGCLCESRAAEQAARRTAMDSATQNAEEMIDDLSLRYNQIRQTAITNEIIEIVAGSQ